MIVPQCLKDTPASYDMEKPARNPIHASRSIVRGFSMTRRQPRYGCTISSWSSTRMKFLSPYTVLPRPDDSYTIPILVLTLTFPSYLGFESTAVPPTPLSRVVMADIYGDSIADYHVPSMEELNVAADDESVSSLVVDSGCNLYVCCLRHRSLVSLLPLRPNASMLEWLWHVVRT